MSGHHRALDGPRWDRARREALERSGWRCEACGAAGRLEVHHKHPLAAGGDPYALDNLEARCKPCHKAAHRRSLTEAEAAWRALVDELC